MTGVSTHYTSDLYGTVNPCLGRRDTDHGTVVSADYRVHYVMSKERPGPAAGVDARDGKGSLNGVCRVYVECSSRDELIKAVHTSALSPTHYKAVLTSC